MSKILQQRMESNVSFISDKEKEFYGCQTIKEKDIILERISKLLNRMMFECATTHIPIKKRFDYFFGEEIFKRLLSECLQLKKQNGQFSTEE